MSDPLTTRAARANFAKVLDDAQNAPVHVRGRKHDAVIVSAKLWERLTDPTDVEIRVREVIDIRSSRDNGALKMTPEPAAGGDLRTLLSFRWPPEGVEIGRDRISGGVEDRTGCWWALLSVGNPRPALVWSDQPWTMPAAGVDSEIPGIANIAACREAMYAAKGTFNVDTSVHRFETRPEGFAVLLDHHRRFNGQLWSLFDPAKEVKP